MENQLNSIFILRLEEMALRKVGVSLVTQPDILELFERIPITRAEELYKSVESKLSHKLSNLPLPESLKKQILLTTFPISAQIICWSFVHKGIFDCCPELPSTLSFPNLLLEVSTFEKLRWTDAGTIDYRKTAEEIIRCKLLTIGNRYRLACLYCLEVYISALKEELPEEIKKIYAEVVVSRLQFTNFRFYWPYLLSGKHTDYTQMMYPPEFYKMSFQYSVRESNKAAAEFFFQKLPEQMKKALLIEAAKRKVERNYEFQDSFPRFDLPDTFCYVLFQLNHEQQMEIFKDHPYKVLCYLLNWPWMDRFLKISEFIWPFLPTKDYLPLLDCMYRYLQLSQHYFPVLFREFFIKSPMMFRKEFVQRVCATGNFFREFLNLQDSKTIKVIFRNVDASDRVTLVSSIEVLKLFLNCIMEGRGFLVKLCLQEATLSINDRCALKEIFMSHHSKDPELNNPLIRSQYLQLLEEIDTSVQNKRSLEHESSNENKKFSP